MPRNKYPEETVKKILDVSLRLFVENGYEQTTVLDIVNNLGGLTRGAFYHHFKSKEEVLEAIFDRRDSQNTAFEKAMKADVATGLERVRLVLKLSLLANIDSERNSAITTLAVSLMSNPRFLVEQIKSNQEVTKILVPMIEEGMADGSIKKGNAKIIADLFLLLSNFWMLPTIYPCTIEEAYEKGEVMDKIFKCLGFNVIDDELEEIFTKVLTTMPW